MSTESDKSEEAHRASSPLQKAAAAVTRLGGLLGAVLILVVLAITSISVFNRYVLGRPLIGVDEATGFLVVAIVMFGAAEALRRGDHIRIDLVFERFGPTGRWWFEMFSYAAILVFSGLLLRTAWHTVVFSRQFGAYSTGYLSLPMWIPQSTMVIGAILLGLAAIAGALRLIGERPK